MTYDEKISAMIDSIQNIYKDAEWLRDIATVEEKKYWNDLRKIFSDAGEPLINLRNVVYRENRHDMKIS